MMKRKKFVFECMIGQESIHWYRIKFTNERNKSKYISIYPSCLWVPRSFKMIYILCDLSADLGYHFLFVFARTFALRSIPNPSLRLEFPMAVCTIIITVWWVLVSSLKLNEMTWYKFYHYKRNSLCKLELYQSWNADKSKIFGI